MSVLCLRGASDGRGGCRGGSERRGGGDQSGLRATTVLGHPSSPAWLLDIASHYEETRATMSDHDECTARRSACDQCLHPRQLSCTSTHASVCSILDWNLSSSCVRHRSSSLFSRCCSHSCCPSLAAVRHTIASHHGKPRKRLLGCEVRPPLHAADVISALKGTELHHSRVCFLRERGAGGRIQRRRVDDREEEPIPDDAGARREKGP